MRIAGLIVLLLPGLACTGRRAFAQPESWRAGVPYEATVLLRFADEPLLTPLFRAATARVVRDTLRNYFGPLANVQVLAGEEAAAHWLSQRWKAGGKATWDDSLFAGRSDAEKVVHFEIRYQNHAYEIAWRMLDVEMRYIGPLHTRRTADRQWLSKAICLAVRDDFGPVADVAFSKQISGKVFLEFQGAASPERMNRLLGETCVLRPYWIVRAADGDVRYQPMQYTLLRRTQGTNNARIDVASAAQQPWQKPARVVGFRAMKIHTETGRLRLRVVDRHTREPAVRTVAYATDRGFDALGAETSLGDADSAGYSKLSPPLAHLAFVRVTQGDGAAYQLPIAITSAVAEETLAITVDTLAGKKSDLVRAVRFLLEDLQTVHVVLDDRVRRINELVDGKRYEAALEAARSAVQYLQEHRPAVEKRLVQLNEQGAKLQAGENGLLRLAGERLAAVGSRADEMSQIARSLEKTVSAVAAADRAKVQVELAQQAEAIGEIDDAISRYELALSEVPQNESIQAKLAALREVWRIKSPEHEAARRVIYERFAPAEIADLDAMLPDVERALAALRVAGDHLSARKVQHAANEHLVEIGALATRLEDNAAEADVAELEKFQAIADCLLALERAAGEFIDRSGR